MRIQLDLEKSEASLINWNNVALSLLLHQSIKGRNDADKIKRIGRTIKNIPI
jgi:hypothetical protein